MKNKSSILLLRNILQVLSYVVLAYLGLLLILQAVNSLHWRMELDTPLLHYAAFLIDKFGYVPYRDIFETSMPGSFAFHYLIGHFFGYGDLVFQVVNLVLLGVFLTAAYLFISRFGKVTALWGIVLFGLVYFGKGQIMTLQRDFVGLIPIALAMLCLPTGKEKSIRLWRFGVIGFLFGISSLFKPHLALGLPVFFAFLLIVRWETKVKRLVDLLKCFGVASFSFVLPIAVVLLWLAGKSALAPFFDIFFNYLPLHTGISGLHEVLVGKDRLVYLVINTLRVGGYGGFAICAAYMIFWLVKNRKLEKPLWLSAAFLVICAVLYAFYPTLAGKFWSYHYMPFALFVCLVTALCTFAWQQAKPTTVMSKWLSIIPVVLLFGAVFLELSPIKYTQNVLADISPAPTAHAPKGGRVDEMAAWLSANLQPGDTIQPLDWTGGSIQAMLISKAPLATRFMYDYHFYHNVSLPYIQNLRSEFIAQLEEAKPRFIIQVNSHKPWVSGVDTTRSFPELEEILTQDYVPVHEGDGYIIFIRTDEN